MTIFEFFKALWICSSIVVPLAVLIPCLAFIWVEDMNIIEGIKLIIKWAKKDLRKMINKE